MEYKTEIGENVISCKCTSIYPYIFGRYYFYHSHNFASHQKCNKLLFTNFLISASASSSSRWCYHHSSSASPMLEFTGGKQTISHSNIPALRRNSGSIQIPRCNIAIQNMFLCKTPFNQLFLIFHT